MSADDEFSLQEGDEDLSEVLQAVQEQAEDAHILVRTLWQIDKTACNLAGIIGLKIHIITYLNYGIFCGKDYTF